MLLKILDALGVSQTIVAKGQEAALDHSGIIAATGVSQQVLAANVLRSGYLIQNRGANPMRVNELGVAVSAVSAGNGSFEIPVSGFFPPEGFPLSTGVVNIIGTINDGFVVREW